MAIAKRGLVLGATAAAAASVIVMGAGLHLSQGKAFFEESPKEVIDEVLRSILRVSETISRHRASITPTLDPENPAGEK